MAYEPLHHKYRPQTFADLVGQDAIATTLTNAIRSQRIAPAYLFTGPRGTGKTSSARILAKSLNCLNSPEPTPQPCGTCEACQTIARSDSLDVIEIDAASNTGVDNIRDLIERAQFVPVQCRYKVYCLDEVHMLSTAAFNALLKTLEEPPPQIVFVLATTDPQRVLPTIISRCQRFDFRRIPLAAMVQHLSHIATQEQIQIAPDAVELVAQIAQGGLRDAESLLDQLSLHPDPVTIVQVWDLVGSVPEQELLKLLQAINAHNPEQVLDCARHLMDRGREPLVILQNLASFYRDALVAKTAPQRRDLVTITEITWASLCELVQDLDVSVILAGQQHLRACEVQVKNTTQPRLWLEVALLGLLEQSTGAAMTPTVTPPVSRPSVSATAPPPSPAPAPTGTSIPVATHAHVVSPPTPSQSPATSSPPPPVASPPPAGPVRGEPDHGLAVSPPRGADASQPSRSEVGPTAGPPPVSPPPVETGPDLPQVWQQILAQLSLPSRALMKEHGTLLSWQGNAVQIGVPKNLLRIAQGRVAEIEETFKKLYQRRVGVTLQDHADSPSQPVASPPRPVNPLSSQPSPPANPAIPATSPATTPPVEPPTQPPPPASPPRVAPTAPVSVSPTSSPSASLASSPPSVPLSSAAVGSPPPRLGGMEDPVTQAVQSFAQFFNGAIVELEEDSLPADQETPTPASPAEEELPQPNGSMPTASALSNLKPGI